MAGGVAQGVGPEFKPQYHKKKKKNLNVVQNLVHHRYSIFFLNDKLMGDNS
jgi:hypothetical protein